MEEKKKKDNEYIKRIHEGHNDANFDLLAKSELLTGKNTVEAINENTEKQIEASAENTEKQIKADTENTEKIIASDKENTTAITEAINENTEKQIEADAENTENITTALENINIDVKTDNTDIVNSLDENTEKITDSINNINLDLGIDNTDIVNSLDENTNKLITENGLNFASLNTNNTELNTLLINALKSSLDALTTALSTTINNMKTNIDDNTQSIENLPDYNEQIENINNQINTINNTIEEIEKEIEGGGGSSGFYISKSITYKYENEVDSNGIKVKGNSYENASWNISIPDFDSELPLWWSSYLIGINFIDTDNPDIILTEYGFILDNDDNTLHASLCLRNVASSDKVAYPTFRFTILVYKKE